MFSYEYCEIFKNHLWWLLMYFFTEYQKEMAQLWRRLNILSKLILHLICQYDAQDAQHSQKQYFFSVDFLVVKIYQNFSITCKNIAFTCVNALLLLLPFIIFIVLLPFSMIFEFNCGLNFNNIRLFYLNCKISFGFLPIKKKSLGLLELASKMKEIWPCIE